MYRLNTTRTLLLLLLLALGLAACGPAQSEEEELATLEALAGESIGAPASEPVEDSTTRVSGHGAISHSASSSSSFFVGGWMSPMP